jgi:hypothetical protein
VHVSVLDRRLLGNGGNTSIERSHSVVANIGSSGGQHRVHNNLCLRVLSPQLLHDLLKVPHDLVFGDTILQVISSSQQVNRRWTSVGKSRQTLRNTRCRIPRDALIKPEAIAWQEIGRQP